MSSFANFLFIDVTYSGVRVRALFSSAIVSTTYLLYKHVHVHRQQESNDIFCVCLCVQRADSVQPGALWHKDVLGAPTSTNAHLIRCQTICVLDRVREMDPSMCLCVQYTTCIVRANP